MDHITTQVILAHHLRRLVSEAKNGLQRGSLLREAGKKLEPAIQMPVKNQGSIGALGGLSWLSV